MVRGRGGDDEGVEDEKGWHSLGGGEKGDLPEGFPSRVCGIPGRPCYLKWFRMEKGKRMEKSKNPKPVL